MRRVLAVGLALLAWPRPSLADSPASVSAPKPTRPLLLLHTAVTRDAESAGAKSASQEPMTLARARQLDVILNDAAQDLGFTLDLSERSLYADRELADVDVIARASGTDEWVVYPSLDARGSEIVVRLVAVRPGSKVALVRSEEVKPADLPVRAVVMLRDLTQARPEERPTEITRLPPEKTQTPAGLATPARSEGRGILAFNAALFGGFIGYSVQRGSGNDDPRVLYPLMALGAGVGLGASAIVAEEWDVGIGDAWYLSAGAWWPALSGLLIARGRDQSDSSGEYGYALAGALGGLGLSTASLALGGGASEGGALMTHSGGAFGTVLGGMTELAIRGSTEGALPYSGLGFGAAIGVVLAGAAATRLHLEPARVLAVDLGAGLGGLAGAAVTSPFIFQKHTPTGDRAFLLTTMAATIAGGVISFCWTRGSSEPAPSALPIVPLAGVLGESEQRGHHSPIVGFGIAGSLR